MKKIIILIMSIFIFGCSNSTTPTIEYNKDSVIGKYKNHFTGVIAEITTLDSLTYKLTFSDSDSNNCLIKYKSEDSKYNLFTFETLPTEKKEISNVNIFFLKCDGIQIQIKHFGFLGTRIRK